MSRRLKQAAVVFVLIFAAAQLVRPGHVNPATDPTHTIQARLGTTSGVVAVLDRACNDCHSNETAWSRYTQIAPVSWLIAYGVSQGRQAVNFSEWTAYPPERQRTLLVESCRDASAGKMPGRPYTLLRPDARLSAEDVETICAASRHAAAPASSSEGMP
jgi:hypothetical protein